MASVTFQNCQRGTVFLCFLMLLLFFIVQTINFIKKRLDPLQDDSAQGAAKYKEDKDSKTGEKAKEETEVKASVEQGDVSTVHFEQKIVKETVVLQDDTGLVKFLKKFQQLQMQYFPVIITFPLNMITGTSKVWQMINFFFLMIVIVFFNVLKVHRSCIEHKCARVVLENAWLFLNFFMLLNIWTTNTVSQPYIVV